MPKCRSIIDSVQLAFTTSGCFSPIRANLLDKTHNFLNLPDRPVEALYKLVVKPIGLHSLKIVILAGNSSCT
ncbi:hypothetical protein [Microseira wollei]|uniref:hypothetical protein n=1 Tax=Microseira wollei TaxID=467598 RepID=UPI001CFD2C5D|nr:hypothetical protein [Microseira wollei]